MLKKLCSYNGCKVLVDYGIKYCDKHKARHNIYKANRLKDKTEKKIQGFYNSIEWIRARELVKTKQYGIDIVEYYKTGKIVAAETYHHIVEVKEDYSMRLDIYNVLGLTNSNHQKIHGKYNKDDYTRLQIQKELKGLLWKFYNEFS
jgi:hypothetical protein